MHTSGRTTTRRRALVAAFALLAITSVSFAGAAPSAGAAPYCGITWGSLGKTDAAMSTSSIFNARTGRHDCFDRMVIDIGPGPNAGYSVRYVPVVVEDGSGDPVPLRGGAFIQVTVHANAHDIDTGVPTYNPPNRLEAANVTGYRTFRQVAFVSDFEGHTNFGLGVRARLPFRVLRLAGPGSGHRLVIDVAHRW
jgi:hypothetical protein